ncbi:MAG: CorA family divalent cation transporter [Thermoplasmata archaeon]|nr:CorA family divalent cation transporter [Thermoplasmata archaeon]
MPVTSLPGALEALGRDASDLARHPVLHASAGTLLTLGLPRAGTTPEWVGIWIESGRATFLGAATPPVGPSIGHGVTGAGATLVDLVADAMRRFLERAEDYDARLADLQRRGREAPAREIWALQRETSGLRALIGRALVVLSEAAGPFGRAFPTAEKALPSLREELERVREIALTVQQSLSDLILMRNAEESNRIAQTANRLSIFSNRIAVLTNTSNIRMLGITYIALLLGLVSATVLIPNTAATILGMPSAAWVPGYWVDALMVVLAVIPIALVFSRPWVLRMLRELKASETRTSEGIDDLPEFAESAALTARAQGDRPLESH